MISEHNLLDFIQTLSNHATIKEAKSGKYIFANEASAQDFGLGSPAEIVGLTVRDLSFSKTSWGGAWMKKVHEMDLLVEQKEPVVENMHVFFTAAGSLKYLNTTKRPLLASRGNVLGIVTFTEDFTRRLSHRLLYEQYRNICGKKLGIQRFLQHLGIESCFFAPPTEAELLVLIERATGKADKEIATAHGVSKRTIETHFVTLRTKLNDNDLPAVVSSLRNPGDTINAI